MRLHTPRAIRPTEAVPRQVALAVALTGEKVHQPEAIGFLIELMLTVDEKARVRLHERTGNALMQALSRLRAQVQLRSASNA